MESNFSLIFIFSGTIEATSPYEAELAALLFVMSKFKDYSTTIFSDSNQLVSNLLYLINNHVGMSNLDSNMIHKIKSSSY